MANYIQDYLYSELPEGIVPNFVEWKVYNKRLPSATEDDMMTLAVLQDGNTQTLYIVKEDKGAYNWVQLFKFPTPDIPLVSGDYALRTNSTDSNLNEWVKIELPKDGIGIDDSEGAKVNSEGILIIKLTNGKKIKAGNVVGVGVSNIEIDSEGNLIVTMSNSEEINAGRVSTATPDWYENDQSSGSYIRNKPAIYSAIDHSTGVLLNNIAANYAEGEYSLAEGSGTSAIGFASHAEGGASTIEGHSSPTVAEGDYSHAEGQASKAIGTASHTEGEYSIARGFASHAEGQSTANGNRSHAEGMSSKTEGDYSHAEGYNTFADGNYSHAEGYLAMAAGEASHAEGSQTTAEGKYAHAEGYQTVAAGDHSHAEGYATTATIEGQHVQGKYSIVDSEGQFADIVGWGNANAHKNISSLTTDGDLHLAGKVYMNSNDDGTGGLPILPEFPTTDGVYKLRLNVSNGVFELSWKLDAD